MDNQDKPQDKAPEALPQVPLEERPDLKALSKEARQSLALRDLVRQPAYRYLKDVAEVVLIAMEGSRLPVNEDERKRFQDAGVTRRALRIIFEQAEHLALKDVSEIEKLLWKTAGSETPVITYEVEKI